uniref:Uncharacterized protein n=1 Tax=Candidatus Kentrum sp. MB TaxID=2138164 RepID=A0A450XZE3_9GAMM|nr:MAG: hypothetical protein BECKMB1821G_GA0114241_10794 [Candidatus Kentron sp. MB]VFK34661.1 MAG: hypothetical protein BECKMB1821I_GA0114274_10794 [Candidatus Kentron sp. MB]VFK76820.1 MAG: hypothetical protein BECKMB1821H_GA0114242_10774 [Candidatus Kentron sp. MB]
MFNDPIVEEMRAHGMAFATRHGNDIGRMCAALREKDLQGREVVQRPESPERKNATRDYKTIISSEVRNLSSTCDTGSLPDRDDSTLGCCSGAEPIVALEEVEMKEASLCLVSVSVSP